MKNEVPGTQRFAVLDAVASHLGWDRDELKAYRYQPTRTYCAVYYVGEEYYTATKMGRKPVETHDAYAGEWRWESVPTSGYVKAMGWHIWRARSGAED